MKKLFQDLQNNTAFFVLTLLTGVAFSCASVISPSISGEMLSAFGSGAENAPGLLAAFLAANLIQAGLSQADNYLSGKLNLRLKRSLRHNAFSGFFRQGDPGREAVSSFGSFLNNDVPALVEQHFIGIIDIVKILSLLILSATSLLRIHWLMAAVILAVSLLLVAVPKAMRDRDSAARKAYSQSMARYNTLLNSLLGGLLVARAYNYERRAEGLLESENEAAAKSETLLLRRGMLIYGASAWLQIIKTVLIFMTGLWLISRGELDLGGLVAVVQLAALISAPLEVLAYLFHARNEAKPLLEAYEAYAATAEPPKSAPLPCGGFSTLALEHVSYTAGDVDILRDVSAEFRAGGKYLVSGESGSGKSTLLRLIAQAGNGGYGGRIRYNGDDIPSIDQTAYRTTVCPVFQEPYLFHATLEENILLGRDIPREEYLDIVARLNLGYLLDRYQGQEMAPEVLEKLSGGERQRVALARAMAGRPGLYLLDEVTSALDKENARLVESLMLHENAAVIHVCHKVDPELSGLYDHKLVMCEGTLKEI